MIFYPTHTYVDMVIQKDDGFEILQSATCQIKGIEFYYNSIENSTTYQQFKYGLADTNLNKFTW